MKLNGIRVLDLSRFLPGPHLAMMMSDHGADVIKVEDIIYGDPTRNIGPKEGGVSVYFRNTNRGKRSLAINLKNEEGRRIFIELAKTADVILETFRPGVVDRLGIGYSTIRTVAPQVVYCSISAFGQSGSYKDSPAHDLSVNALSGVLSMSKNEDGEPSIPCLPPSDLAGSLMALSGILMALFRRQETGKGDYLDMSMYDAVFSWTPHIIGKVFSEDKAPDPSTERTQGGSAFYGVYQTADKKWITLGGSEIKFVENFLIAMDRQDLISCGKLPPGCQQKPLKKYLKETFMTKTQKEWINWFQGKDICFAPVFNMKEAMDIPQLNDREMIIQDNDGNRQLGVPIKFEDEPASPSMHAPRLGENTADILREIGYNKNFVAEMEKEKIIVLG
ncbi:MAG: CoA transferase [Alphaproteobacteria bacterium]|nr:CoA transferase [Alphaproteobacteria bacterium]|tara:strand:- start:1837 stop:3006 length:1170 start_codon:yes stop_codon:yes gene_type:complete